MGRRNPNRIPVGIRLGRIPLHRETHCGPLNGINPSLSLLFVLILPAPLKRTRLGRMKMGTLQRSIKTMLFALVLWSSFLIWNHHWDTLKVVAIVFVNLNAVVFIALDIGIQRRKKLSSSRKE